MLLVRQKCMSSLPCLSFICFFFTRRHTKRVRCTVYRHQSSEICEPPKAATDRQPSATATPEQFTAAQRLLDRMSEEVRMTSQTLTTGALELGWLCECAQAPQALLMQLVECKACKRCVLRRRAAAHRAKCVIAPPKQSVSDQLPSSSYPGKAAAAGLQATGLGMPAAAVSQGQAQDAKGKGGLPKVPKPSKSGGSKSVSARNGGSAADAAAAAVAAAGGLRPTKLSKVTFPAASASPSTMQDASTGPSDSYSIVEAFMNFQSDVLSFPSSVRRKRSSVPVRCERVLAVLAACVCCAHCAPGQSQQSNTHLSSMMCSMMCTSDKALS